MKKLLIYLSLSISLIPFCSYANKINLEKIINKEEVRLKKYIDRNSRLDDYKYIVRKENVYLEDFNKDGINDIAIIFYSCEEQSCHVSTSSRYVTLLQGEKGNKYSYVTSTYIKGLKANIRVTGGEIRVTSYDYSSNDPSCCPSIQRNYIYKLGKDLDNHTKLIESSY